MLLILTSPSNKIGVNATTQLPCVDLRDASEERLVVDVPFAVKGARVCYKSKYMQEPQPLTSWIVDSKTVEFYSPSDELWNRSRFNGTKHVFFHASKPLITITLERSGDSKLFSFQFPVAKTSGHINMRKGLSSCAFDSEGKIYIWDEGKQEWKEPVRSKLIGRSKKDTKEKKRRSNLKSFQPQLPPTPKIEELLIPPQDPMTVAMTSMYSDEEKEDKSCGSSVGGFSVEDIFVPAFSDDDHGLFDLPPCYVEPFNGPIDDGDFNYLEDWLLSSSSSSSSLDMIDTHLSLF